MPAVYFASDLVMLTSDNEGTPVSLIEAQAAGVPVVTTRVGGARSVVSQERLVESGDESALSRIVRELLTDPRALPKRAPSAAADVRQRFALDRLLADIDELYRQTLLRTG